jgi:hypothetical protein
MGSVQVCACTHTSSTAVSQRPLAQPINSTVVYSKRDCKFNLLTQGTTDRGVPLTK